jgi:hypothetical protein
MIRDGCGVLSPAMRAVSAPRWLTNAAALLICAGLAWLAFGVLIFGVGALTTDPSPASPLNAVDLRGRFDETRLWFDRESAYLTKPESAVYPPAAYPLFWLLLGWGDFRTVRVVWALCSLLGLLLLSAWVSRVTPVDRPWQWVLLLLPSALVATKIALGLGQLSLVLVPVSIGAARLAFVPSRDRAQQVVLIGLLLLALVKPSIGLPFAVLCLFRMTWPERVGLVAGYAALTVVAASFQSAGLIELVGQWQRNTAAVVGSNDFGYANLNWALTKAGMARWNTVGSLIVLTAYAAWAWSRRDLGMVRAIAISGLVARLWAYHSSYDDLLVLPAVAALCVIQPRWVGLLLACAIAVSGLDQIQTYGYQIFGGDGFAWAMAALWVGAIVALQIRPTAANSARDLAAL